MLKKFQFVVRKLIQLTDQGPAPNFKNLEKILTNKREVDRVEIYRAINRAFLITLSGEEQPGYELASAFLTHAAGLPKWRQLGSFFLDLKQKVAEEIERVTSQNPEFASRMEYLSSMLNQDLSQVEDNQIVEMLWSTFHPEATGIWSHEEQRIINLREKRQIRITGLNPDPIREPARQVLFTANALLTVPPKSQPLDQLKLSESLKEELSSAMAEPQLYWYDHPIQIGVEADKNEVLYGLQGLQEALDYEIEHGNLSEGDQLTCLLSVSVTHAGLHRISRRYLSEALGRSQPLPGLKIFAFTEDDSQELINQVLAPAARHYLGEEQANEMLRVLGVDGEYGRHYTFLKAIAALWQVLIDPQIKATFKIDLDQVFPQAVLQKETGLSACEHLKTPLWGASGLDAGDQPVELGMIAGALVNEDDIDKNLFTPDVPFPPSERDFSPDEWMFFSQLPQALSTQAEMMARYNTPDLDGVRACLQRVHVTGGTNGILVHSLFRYKPFTPSFIGRAEDQAYILSTIAEPGRKLAYLHQPGLIMRHDKQAFAQEAIQAAQVGKLIGDYVRILNFSAYGQTIEIDLPEVKDRLDPFTGSFISYIPITLTSLRFALKAESFFTSGETQLGVEFLELGAQRISQALKFAAGELRQQYLQERQGWALYYDTLIALQRGLQNGDFVAEEFSRKANNLVHKLAIQTE